VTDYRFDQWDDDEYCEPEPTIPAHGGIVRILSAAQDPRLHIESGFLGRGAGERLLWIVYLKPPPRMARILRFRAPVKGAPS
jgi:hypothetical protein